MEVTYVCVGASAIWCRGQVSRLIGTASGGVSTVMGHRKPWVRALHAFRMVSSNLLPSFLPTGLKTWEEICEYLERARLYPTCRHWVDNLITPTLFAHQLLLGWVIWLSTQWRLVSGVFITLSGGYYINRRLLHYRL